MPEFYDGCVQIKQDHSCEQVTDWTVAQQITCTQNKRKSTCNAKMKSCKFNMIRAKHTTIISRNDDAANRREGQDRVEVDNSFK